MGQKILTVDDSKSIRQMVRFTLSAAGYEVVEAKDGLEALDVSAETSPHMVIVDVHMPRLDGIETVRRMRAAPATKYVPIVMLTTETEMEKKKEGKKAGATGWIVKPFNPDQLLAVVRKVLG